MTNTQTGECKKCGGPIYGSSVWHGITPQPQQRSCNCFPRMELIVINNINMKYNRTASKRSQGIKTPKRRKPQAFTHSFITSCNAIENCNLIKLK